MRTLMFGAVLAVSLAGSAMAAGPPQDAWLTLKGKTSVDHVILDGAVWTCKVNVCRSEKVRDTPPGRACRRLAAKLGPVTTFAYRGEAFTTEALAACNAPTAAD
ncbi:MAG: hypothetical protein Q8L66_16600 [Caulobacter sp.]|nr:hypothetical protein [Caulobacter sp.]